MTNKKRLFLAAASLLVGMGSASIVLLLTTKNAKRPYQPGYAPGSTPPPVPDASAPPLVTTPEPSPTPGPGETKRPEVTYYQLVDTTDGPVLRPHALTLTATAPTEEERLRQAIQAMAEGEAAPLPRGTKLLRLKHEGSTVILDLSKELKANFAGGDKAEVLVLNALTATAAQLPSAEKLQIFVAGEAIETLAGGQSLLEPLTIARK